MKGAAALVGTAAAGASFPRIASATPAPARAARAKGNQRVTTPDDAIVDTTAGKVRGFTRNGVFIFKGIPYGDTPGW